MTNEVATLKPTKSMSVSASRVMPFRPSTAEEMMAMAKAVCESEMVPKSYQGKPINAFVAMIAGAELGLSALQSLQSIAVVNGTPTLWGDGLMAVCRNSGACILETIEGSGDTLIATCSVTRPDSGEVITRTYSAADAKAAGLWTKSGTWQLHKKRMMQMRARGFACRDGMADVLRGFQIREVMEDDFPNAPNSAAPMRALPASINDDYLPEVAQIEHTPEVEDDDQVTNTKAISELITGALDLEQLETAQTAITDAPMSDGMRIALQSLHDDRRDALTSQDVRTHREEAA